MTGTVYTTVAKARQVGLSGRAFADTDAPDFEANIAAASDEASSLLGNQYTLPLVQWGQDLEAAVAKIACYEFLSVRGLDPDKGGSDLNVYNRAKDARAWLKMVAQGLATPVGIIDSSTTNTPVGVPSSQPDVTSSSQRGWTVRGGPPGCGRGPFVGN